MGRFSPPEKRTRTPFLDEARNGNRHADHLLHIAIADLLAELANVGAKSRVAKHK